MNIALINIQPDADSINAAYRPVFFQVYADALVPPDQPMYADVYFYGLFYKSYTSFSIKNVGGTNSVFEFDIQDACQEYLQTFVPSIPLVNVVQSNLVFPPYSLIDDVLVRFRGSTFSGGLLVPNPTVPVQGTSTTPPISGTGTASNDFKVLNATIFPDPYLDVTSFSELEDVLAAHKVVPPVGYLPDTRIYPLSNLPLNSYTAPNVSLCPDVYAADHGGFPIYIAQFGTAGSLDRYTRDCRLFLEYYINGVFSTRVTIALTGLAVIGVTKGTWYLPCGLKEVALFTPSIMPTLLNPANNIYYRIVLFDADANQQAFVSPMFKIRNRGIEELRLWFQNAYGHFEQVSFVRNTEQHVVTSSEQFRPYLPMVTGFTGATNIDYLQTGRSRFNVRGQDEISLTGVFQEALMPWLKELMRTGYCYLDQPDITSFGTPHDLRAVKIIDGTFQTRKTIIDGRIYYEVTFKMVPSLDYITLRN